MYLTSLQVYLVFIQIIKIVSFQYSELMKEYYLTCGGDYFCLDATKTKLWDIFPIYSYRHLGLCPECSCDNGCIRRGDCCPDLFFTFPEMECVNRTIIKGIGDKARDQRYSEFMVTRCPEKTEPEIKQQCESNTDIQSRLVQFPVTGRSIPLTFYNKYCAECNGVTEVVFWNLDIQCDLFADFNYLSTIDDIIKTAFDSFCTFQTYYPHDKNAIAPNCFEIIEDKALFSKCNQTGKWKNFDANINYACESYNKVQYRLFKNIFCYMCNPSVDESEEIVISKCNVTGQWKIYDEGLEKGCVLLPNSSTVRPFKNIFCYLCNRGNDSYEPFVDIKGSIEEYIIKDDHFRFQYNVNIRSFNFEYFAHSLVLNLSHNQENVSREIYRPFSDSTFTLENGTLINIQSLVNQAIAIDVREVGVCPKRRLILPPEFKSTCVCAPKCLYQNRNRCCADLALELRTICVDELALSNIADFRRNKKGYLLINGCFQERTYALFQDRCSRRHLNDVYSVLPVTHNGRAVTYNNLFCVLCNLDSTDYVNTLNGYIKIHGFDGIKKSNKKKTIFSTLRDAEGQIEHAQYTVWSFDITCPVYLDFSHYVKLGDLLPIAKKQKCRILYKTTVKVSDACDKRPQHDCSKLTDWTYTDPNVQWACKYAINFPFIYSISMPDEYPNINVPWRNKTHRPGSIWQYPNVFCALCSPVRNFSMETIDFCNATGMASSSASRNSVYNKCLQSPFIYYYYPFKNVYCVLCNGVPISATASGSSSSNLTYYDRAAPDVTWFPLLRNLFSIVQDDTIIDVKEKVTTLCSENQVFDFKAGRCRNITCFAGKYLQGTECKPLLEITNNLRYSLTLLVGVTSRKQIRVRDLLENGASQMERFLSTSLYDEGVFISHFSALAQEPCAEIVERNNFTHFEIYTEVFFRKSVFRRDLETKIVSINQKRLNGTDILSSMEFVVGTERFELLRQGPESCGLAFRQFSSVSYMNTVRYYAAKASNVLLCPQVELLRDEYNISDDRSQITLSNVDVVVDNSQFGMTPDGQMRICYEYLRNIDYFGHSERNNEAVSDLSLKYLWIVSLTCTTVSLVCLLLGLIVYCLFPVLRTTPGKLVMSFMGSLFLTLLFQSLSYFMTNTDEGCIIVGVVSHFTWLSVFTSMQTCNFHMYKVFSSNKPTRSSHTTSFFDKTTVFYTVYIFCVSVLIVTANIGLTRLISQGSLLGYGGSKCFMDNTVSVILAFICPVFLICILNVLFYFLTIRIIHNTPTPTGNDPQRNELRIFIRLVTITGMSWIIQVLDSFFPLTAFSYVAATINSLQGLFVFIAFVVNKRNVMLLRGKFVRSNRQGFSTSPSASSATTSKYGTDSSQVTTSTKL